MTRIDMTLIHVAAASLNQTPLDWDANAANIISAIRCARQKGVSILCFPEMCITGYGCEDAFQAPGMLRTAEDMLLEILEMHELAPRDAVMVGDTEFDLEMASRAGVDAVGVTWGAHDINRLQRHNPKICVDSVDQLSRWLHQAV